MGGRLNPCIDSMALCERCREEGCWLCPWSIIFRRTGKIPQTPKTFGFFSFPQLQRTKLWKSVNGAIKTLATIWLSFEQTLKKWGKDSIQSVLFVW